VSRGTDATSTQIHIQKDETSGKAVIQTQRGLKKLSRAELEAAECDAVITEPGKRNRSTVPPSVRQAALARDKHRCRASGCRNAHFLEIHHIAALNRGGTNDPDNLVTLCAACHRLLHESALDGEWFRRP
jgi:5-methylcytosine-specific restriction endonuclease McrA